MRALRWWWCGVVAAVLAAAAGAQAPAKPVYTGTPLCIKCHIDFARRWAGLEHSKKLLNEKLPQEQQGCEACHGAGGSHVAGKRDQIIKWSKLGIQQRSEICLQCHQEKVPRELWMASPHATKAPCDRCHEVHQPVKQEKLLKAEPPASCLECHDSLPKAIEAKTHHTLSEGALSCDSCHQFHGSENRHLLNQPMGELCATCHGDEVPKPDNHQREGWKLKHGADAKGKQDTCLMCHDQESFCNRCHAVPMPHPENFAADHATASKKYPDSCLQCHQADFCTMCHETVPAPVGKPGQK